MEHEQVAPNKRLPDGANVQDDPGGKAHGLEAAGGKGHGLEVTASEPNAPSGPGNQAPVGRSADAER